MHRGEVQRTAEEIGTPKAPDEPGARASGRVAGRVRCAYQGVRKRPTLLALTGWPSMKARSTLPRCCPGQHDANRGIALAAQEQVPNGTGWLSCMPLGVVARTR